MKGVRKEGKKEGRNEWRKEETNEGRNGKKGRMKVEEKTMKSKKDEFNFKFQTKQNERIIYCHNIYGNRSHK